MRCRAYGGFTSDGDRTVARGDVMSGWSKEDSDRLVTRGPVFSEGSKVDSDRCRE